ncbi:TonB-dependent receptor [Zhouia sp. PK063]|uniref:TonB-dependent receptor n=1 Tax=Zhouia sp. PK063 TaxID=3373602 RepID=UPI0037A01BF9
MKQQHILAIAVTFFTVVQAVAQDKDQDKNKIGTQTVDVVKPYTPTLSDAFKIKENPSLNDSVTTQQKKINYSIFSVPVASTFTPAKGKAEVLPKAARESLYNTYLALGLGNYSNAALDFYHSSAISRDEMFDLSLTHHSSQGGIKDVYLDDKFFNTKLQAAYRNTSRYSNWGVQGGFQHQIYNWYGLPANAPISESDMQSIDPQQTYYNAFVGANLELKDAYFTGGEIFARQFWDAYGSSESRAILTPTFEFPAGDVKVNAGLKVDYINGSFDRAYKTENEIKYSNAIFAVSPSFMLLNDDLKLKLGAEIAYRLDIENSDSDFYIYPDVSVYYNLVDEYVNVYGGVKGGLIQNSYYDFVQNNQFVSPTLNVMPTDKQYNAYVGVKGKFIPSVSFNLKGSYMAENDKVLYQNHVLTSTRNENYKFGNSYDVIYDDVKTLNIFGEIGVDVSRNFSLGVNATIADYSTDAQPEAWNLPTISGSLFSDFQIGEKWYGGVNLFYVGERKDISTNNQVMTLDSYFDANAHIGYHINKQLSAFLKANNIGGTEYFRWENYPVQGFQILAGASYKFDL